MKAAIVLFGIASVVFLVIVLGFEPSTFRAESGPIEAPEDVYDPVRAGEQTPEGFVQVLPRDAIMPVYNPVFEPASASDWPDDALVIGLSLEEEAKAYPVSFLNRREMVIDWIGGTPVLVTW